MEGESIANSTLEESLEGPYLIRVEQPVNAEKTFIAPSKTLSQPVDDEEEEFSLDSLDFNFTSYGDANCNRRSIIGQLNSANNLSAIAAEYASTSIEESVDDAEESEVKEPSADVSDEFDPFDLLETKKVFNFKDLTAKQALTTMNKLNSKVETCKKMYPTMIKDNVKKNLENLEAQLRSKVQDLEEERKKPITIDEDEENGLLVKIIHQLEHKLNSLNEHLKIASDLMKSYATE
ncbi:uncharacterized protein LOC107359833 [Tetranychus urticae]|uniref:uncharacterized protein LOC107359833 n=1 Tax=Tetranychus urticae TaxID=32264 RepID=UPI000355B7A0|nr:uncharacterized protein LOC107359833 [Tetranychus urticae]